mmetsp:Transcript_110757/g.286301  ORF Transcript_110757/g.286301 Transcript_110757/m.286301 type:complete len:283 (-) Transcript_110757:265-1113(-)
MARTWDSYRPGYSMMDAVEEKPTVRASKFLAPSGTALLMLSALLASGTAVCGEECIRTAESLSDRLLDCEEHCTVHGQSATGSNECKDRCAKSVGFTSSRVKREEGKCKKACASSPGFMRFCAFTGTALMLCVVPLLGSYKGACRCDCCIGLGCSARVALFNIAWTSYGFSIMWALPSVLEDAGEVGGKVLFALTQATAMITMASSRVYADRASAGVPPAPGPTQMAIVGAPVAGPSNAELQQQIQELQQQVRELVKLQTLQASAAPSTAVPNVSPNGSNQF